MKRKISLETVEESISHAIVKARADVNVVLRQCDYRPLLFGSTSPIGLWRVLMRHYDIWSLKWKIGRNDTVFIQFPWIHNNKKEFYRNLFRSGARVECVVHDLDSFRYSEDTAQHADELEQLNRCHSIIAHTPAMKDYLAKHGVSPEKIKTLYFFPYLTTDPVHDWRAERNRTIIFAGNLAKSPFVNRLQTIASPSLRFNLYGKGVTDFDGGEYVCYKGIFSPDHPGEIEGGWGLVWDGAELETCSGAYGSYLRYNSSHKISLYLSLGIPVILWNESSLSEYVLKNHLGITVGSLGELQTAIEQLSADQLKEIYTSVQRFAPQIRSGEILRKLIDCDTPPISFAELEKNLFCFAKERFHKSDSKKECAYLLSFFWKNTSRLKPKLNLLSKFVWHRLVQPHLNKSADFLLAEEQYKSYIEQPKTGRRVLIFTHEMNLTGAPRAALTLARVLRQNGAEAVMISSRKGDLVDEAVAQGVPVVIEPLLEYKLYKREQVFRQLINSFDVLLFNTLETIVFAPYLTDCKAQKLGWVHEGSVGFDINSYRDLEADFRLLDKVYAVGDYSLSFVLRYVHEAGKAENLLYGSTDEFSPNAQHEAPNGKIRVLLLGSVDRRKGLHLLTDALGMLSPEVRSKMEVVVVGSPVDSHIVRELKANRYGCVSYLGPKSHDEAMDILRSADVLLCPSLDDPMPIVCTEAMMLRKVVVVSQNTGTASLITSGANGFVIPADSSEAIAQVLTTFSERRSDFLSIGASARQTYEQYFSLPIFEQNVKRIFKL